MELKIMPTTNQKEKPEKKEPFQTVKGMHDVLPSDEACWEKIETVMRDVAHASGFCRLEPPVLEVADLYRKTSGEESDVVEKEMYTVHTKGGDVLALRPEYTPGICRAYIEHSMSRMGQPQKLFHFGPVFRHDRPQLGRYRQFAQIGLEVLGGVNDPIYDAEIIALFFEILTQLRIKNSVIKLNSVGCRVCRPLYKKQLQSYYHNHEKELCEDCVRRLKTNPLKLLDCKDASCIPLKEKAPVFLDKICVNCKAHFRGVLEYLEEINMSYEIDNQLVRGLDYYSRTVFEIFADGPEADIGALVGGGRYDYLMEAIGGHGAPAVGGASGVERLIAVMQARGISFAPREKKKVFLAHAGSLAKKRAFALLQELRSSGISVSEALSKESLNAQLKAANKDGAALALILGQKEIYENSVIIRDLVTGLQESILVSKVVEEIKKRFK